MQPGLNVEMGFVQRRLPWLIAAGAFVVYLLTLNYGCTFAGVMSLANAVGWDWRSSVVAPVHVILTYPIRWLPAGIELTALNVLAAACSALALGLLARSVALLPHDRTREQRALERSEHSMLSLRAAWLPPLLAALVCGLQMTFWENAVVATGEALDLLLFAWLIDCLLHYRLDGKESRLRWFAFVYGLAITNNYAMVGMFVPFLIAVFWIKGLEAWKWRFMLRMALFGLAGLSLYVVLPLAQSASDLSNYTTWELLKSYWSVQRGAVFGTPRYIILICSLTSLVPVLFMGIRWPAQFGESSPLGNTLINLMMQVIHVVFLLACIYVAFDPPFSPRGLTAETMTMLPLYYLGALAVGYCAGYCLLVFGAKPGPQAWQRPSLLRRGANVAVVAFVWAALVGVPAGLLVQNLPRIWANTGRGMDRLAHRIAQSLPPEGAVVLSEAPFPLYSLQYDLFKSHSLGKYVLIETSQLVASGYHRYMQLRYPDRWPSFQRPTDPKSLVDSYTLINLVGQFMASNRVFYLHPSFGYYFEVFYTTPRQMLYELRPYSDPMSVNPPTLTAAEVQEQDAFWQSLAEPELEPLIKAAKPFIKPSKGRTQTKTLAAMLGEFYSRALDDFGVQAQRTGNFALAAKYFDLAVRLNPGNPAAYLNRDYNRAWQAQAHPAYKLSDEATARLQVFHGRWDSILGLNGPIDEPGACLFLANSFQDGVNFRQSAQNLERSLFFDPDNQTAQISLCLMCVKTLLPDLALKYLADFRARHPVADLKEEDQLNLISIEAWARVLKNDLPGAEQLLTAAQQSHPKQSIPYDTQVDIYLKLGQATNAIEVLDRQLQANPDSARALINRGYLAVNLNQPASGLPYLDRAVEINSKDEAALFNRALANLQLEHLDAAQKDLETIRSTGRPGYLPKALYYLGEVYYRKKNRKESLKRYKELLGLIPAGAAETPMIKERIRRLEDGAAL